MITFSFVESVCMEVGASLVDTLEDLKDLWISVVSTPKQI